MRVEIITPEYTLFHSDNVRSVTSPGIDGTFELLDKHAPIIVALKEGEIVLTTENGKERFGIQSGLLECKNNMVNIMVEA